MTDVKELKLDSPVALLIYRMPEDRDELKEVLRVHDYSAMVSHIWNKIRSKLKYEELSDTEVKCFEEVKKWFLEAADDYGVDFY